jgi:hypothetical protein
MTIWDYLKALITGFAVLALNLLTLVALMFGYGQFIAPGHPPEFYTEAAPRLGAWSGPIAGALLIFLFVWLLSRRRPQRNAYAFAAATFVSYAAIDIALGLATSTPAQLFTSAFALSLAGVCATAFAGAYLAKR